jgi:hypothetical protein
LGKSGLKGRHKTLMEGGVAFAISALQALSRISKTQAFR